jgi:hypothetical protein
MTRHRPEKARAWHATIEAWRRSGQTAAVFLSVCGSATRHRLNPWSYVRDVLDQLAARSADADVSDLLPDARAVRHPRIN